VSSNGASRATPKLAIKSNLNDLLDKNKRQRDKKLTKLYN